MSKTTLFGNRLKKAPIRFFVMLLSLILIGVFTIFLSGCGNCGKQSGASKDDAIKTKEPSQKYYSAIDACMMPDQKMLVLFAQPADVKNLVTAVVRFDQSGKAEKEFDLTLHFPHSINPTGQGTYLISDHGRNRLLEIDGDGKIVKAIFDRELGLEGFNINSARVTKKGTVLAAGRDWGIAEFNMTPKLLWTYKLVEGDEVPFQTMGAHDATLLPDNKIMYISTAENQVIVVDRKGRKVSTFTDKSVVLPKNARHLDNGNLLISHRNGLTEFSPTGKVIRKNDTLKSCYNFKVLPDGGVMVAHAIRGVVFLDKDLKITKTVAYKNPPSWEYLKEGLLWDEIEGLISLGYLR